MSTRVAINGFGRIGRLYLRAALKRGSDLQIVAVNDITDAPTLAHLFKYDSIHGIWPGDVSAGDGDLIIDGHRVKVLSATDISLLPWRELGVQIGTECHHEDVCVERPCRGGGAPRDGIDGRHGGLDHAYAGLHDVDVAVDDVGCGHAAEHDVELGEAEHEPVRLVEQHDVGVVAELLRQARRDLEAAEPGSQHQNSHGGRLGIDGGPVRCFDALRQARPAVIASSRSRTRGSW